VVVRSNNQFIALRHNRGDALQIGGYFFLLSVFHNEESDGFGEQANQQNGDQYRYSAAYKEYRLPSVIPNERGDGPSGKSRAEGEAGKHRHHGRVSRSPRHVFGRK